MLGDFGATMRKPENCLTPQHVVDLMSGDGAEMLCGTTLFTEARHAVQHGARPVWLSAEVGLRL
jgi:hypothetical protein